jgi:hypothetical protein
VADLRVAGSLTIVSNDEDDARLRQRRAHNRAATRHERGARREREAADTSEILGDPGGAERHREAARRLERGADDERQIAADERSREP